MALSCGIVGLPNVGKSTLFNALTGADAGVGPYAFVTTEPQVSVVGVPDARLAVINGFIGCEFVLEGIVDLNLVCEGEVLLDGEPLICNEDWVLLDESTLKILGEACDILGDGELHTLDASWPCGAVQIP